MDEIENVRNRIKERRYVEQNYKASKLVFLVVCMGLVSLIYLNDKGIVEIENISTYKDSLIGFILTPFEKTNKNNDSEIEVAGSFPYTCLDDNMFISTNSEVVTLFDGLVVYVGEENNNYMVIVSCDNDVQIVYENLNSINVNLYDRVVRDSVIGMYDQYVVMRFKENNNDVSFERILEKY